MRIGVYGGSFNPIHNKHTLVINELLNKYLDKIIVVPAGDKYSKDGLINSSHRINMIRLAINPDRNKIIDDFECGEERKYTFETLNHIKKLYPEEEIYFVMGMDNLFELDTWREYEYILANFKILVMKRDGYEYNEIIKKYEKYKDNIILTDLPSDGVSASYIRKYIENENKIKNIIDSKVYNYIKENELYIR